ncbi:response regulator [Streptomyces caeruleatus]|uniref:LuxR family transcriptional regulator n=1 Tax=Streptomyces caeruleatus TaxID=661399 RepID=A0A101U3Z0_9ACTN|nr:response regulator transcription factor [Streptomyces caeruleatus]KUO03748.1 LuxR family transcriptional regulator [Streptomyces caeruleatus]
MTTENAVRVLLCDDHPLYLDGMEAALSCVPDIEVVGRATTGAEALTLAAELRPDLVVMDLNLPDMSGIDAIRELSGVAILVLSMSEEDSSVLAALRAGAQGYLVKGARRAEILRAVRTVADGGAVFSGVVAAHLTACLTAPVGGGTPAALPELTDREREVLDLVARGHDNRRISRELFLSEKTVRNHLSHVFAKLRVRDRAAAVARARDAGLGQG